MPFFGPPWNELDVQQTQCCFRVYVYFQVDATYSGEKYFLFLKNDVATMIFSPSINLLFGRMCIYWLHINETYNLK